MTEKHKNVFSALAAAQAEMGPATKNATNQHFKSAYADLASVYSAILPPLNRHGLALFHTTEIIADTEYMTTILHHGESSTDVRCPVRLIVNKADMQGYKSATTYAKRIGTESLCGIAPEDDDGNGAAKAPVQTVSPDQFIRLRDLAEEAGSNEADVCKAYGAPSFQQFPLHGYEGAVGKLRRKIEMKPKSDPLNGDEIPEFDK